MQTYTAHVTMRNGLAAQVSVSATCRIEAHRQLFKLYRNIASATLPKVKQ